MKHDDVKLILATGGSAMVKAAYSSGTPALGVGPGNVPVFVERTADLPLAAKTYRAGKILRQWNHLRIGTGTSRGRRCL